MKAIILSAGYGTRLRPLCDATAKPLVKVLGIPLIEYTLNFMSNNGIEDVYVNRHYFPEKFSDVVVPDGLRVHYSVEKDILGTLGGVNSFREHLDDDFLVVNGDILFDFDLSGVVHAHKQRKNIATLLLKPRIGDVSPVYVDDFYNIVNIGNRAFNTAGIYKEYMFSGIQLMNKNVFDLTKELSVPACLVKDLYIPHLNSGMHLTAYVPKKEILWMEAGDMSSYLRTNLNVLDLLSRYKLSINTESFISENWVESVEGIWLGDGYFIDPEAMILPPVLVGRGSKILAGSVVGPNAIVGDNCIIGERSNVRDSVILDNTNISNSTLVEGMVVGNDFIFNSSNTQ